MNNQPLNLTALQNAALLGAFTPGSNVPGLQVMPQPSSPAQGVLGVSTTAGGGYASGPAGPSLPAANTQAIQQYDQGINNTQSAIDRLPGQLDVGNRNIDTGYNSALNNVNTQKATGERNYNQNKLQTGQNFVQAKNQIGSQAGNSLNSLLRLLGARGAGGSTAATQVAPGAVARNATLQRTGAGNTFAQNNQSLDTNWNDYMQGFNTSVADLGRQRENNRNSLQSQIDQTKASLLQNLATLTGQRTQAAGGNPVTSAQPYLDQANTLLSQADQLGLQAPVYQQAPLTYNAPSLASYTTNPNGPQIQSGASPSLQDSVTPYLSLLLGRRNQPNLSAAF